MSTVWHELRFRREHRWTPRHMSAYLDFGLTPRAQARFEHHTAECQECRSILEDLRHMLALLQTAPAPAPDVAALAGSVLRRLHEPAEP